MAAAVKQLWPQAKLAIGPSIEDGFYYDFDLKQPLTDADLSAIEEKMAQIVAADMPFVREDLSKADALALFEKLGETYKLELIRAISDEKVSVYRTGDGFVDLCRGPHVASTGMIKAFKLLSLAGAYWHGIETNPMLQRIYGTCFESEKELKEHLSDLEQRKLRDHRKLGPSLGLFDIYQEEAGPGLVFYHPHGATLRRIIEDYEKDEHRRRGYEMVITPHIMQADLWKTSGHLEYYKENMYTFKIEEKEFVLKPMNCPGHILIYKSATRSYKDLPLRLFELGTVYRHEKAGVMHGLLRVRGFTQDDAHIFCLPDQLKSEIKAVVDFVFTTMKVFGFKDIGIELSTRPEKFIGAETDWDLATGALENSLKELNLQYDINEGDGAFYGPKIDIKLKDALKRSWQCATVQCDFNLPKRFDLAYIDAEGNKQQPIMLHRVLLGSVERFIACLTEHYAGDFPVWLAPVQAAVIPIKESCQEFAAGVARQMEAAGVRCQVNARNETLGKRIRQAEMVKVPFVLVIGEREVCSQQVAVRKRREGDLGSMTVDKCIELVREQINNRV